MKTDKTISYTLLLILVFISACSLTSHKPVKEQHIPLTADIRTDQIKDSIVLIENENRKNYGFFVGEDKIVTNIHAIAHPGNISIKSISNDKLWTVEGIFAFDAKNKIVVLKVAGNGTPLILGDSNTIAFDQSVYIPNYIDKDVIATDGRIISVRDDNSWFRVKSDTSNRINGSPVFNNRGQVIGVIVPYGRVKSSYAIPSRVLNELFKKSNTVEPTTEWQKRILVRAEAHYSLGVQELDNDRYTEAIAHLDKAIVLNPDYSHAYLERGDAYYSLGDFVNAMDACSKAIRIDPHDTDAYTSIGAVNYHLGKPHDAILDFNRAIQLDPRNALAHSNLAITKHGIAEQEIRRGNVDAATSLYQEAITILDKAIQIVPDYATAYSNRGIVKLALDDHDGALLDFNNAIAYKPEFGNAYSNRSAIWLYQAETESDEDNSQKVLTLLQKAVVDCDTAIQFEPKNATAYSNRAAAKDGIGDYESQRGSTEVAMRLHKEAKSDCDKAIELRPDHPQAYSNRASSTIAIGDLKYRFGKKKVARELYNAAVVDCDKSIQINSKYNSSFKNRATAKCKLADIEIENGYSDKVRELYHQGMEDYSKSIQLRNLKDLISHKELQISEIVSDSTVMILVWSGVLGDFSNGSGFFVDKDKIVTNIHVVNTASAIFAKHRKEEAIWKIAGVHGYDVDNDLVILKIAAEGIPLSIGDSDTARKGDSVFSIGYIDRKYKVEKGTIHSIRNHDKWIRMNKRSGDGGSGGPILNENNEVIGVSVIGGNIGDKPYSAAISSNTLKKLLNSTVPTVPLREWQNRNKIQAYTYHELGEEELENEEYQEAINYFNISVKLNPEYIYAYSSRAKAKFVLGMYQEAIADYDQAIQLNPEIVYIRWDRALAKYDHQDYKGAIDDFDKVIELYPKFAGAYYKRGKAKDAMGEKEDAKANFEMAKTLDPNIGE
ncbi:tetratricopeptide repeat protein [Candidatus Poribacteria bacterium]|nr:tetratricopeptide repeat protein [Candidatus Poribacteria bacterium]